MTRRAMLYGTALLTAAAVVSHAWDAVAQQLVTPPDIYMPLVQTADDDNVFWYYVAGLSSGANAAWIAQSGEPLFCKPHGFSDHDATRDVILTFLATLDDIGPTTILEAVVPGASALAYPCDEGPAL